MVPTRASCDLPSEGGSHTRADSAPSGPDPEPRQTFVPPSLDIYSHCGYTHRVTIRPETLLPLPPATFYILAAVANEGRHGYAIMQDVEARTSGQLRLSAGTLYRSIQRMLDQGLIKEVSQRPAAEHDDERRRYYRITPFGTAVAKAESRRLAQMLQIAREQGLAPEKA
jgi:DNA-binding PadR family transcriptional regulator